MKNIVYIGIKGRVLALDRSTGDILWSTKLKNSYYVAIHLDGDRIIAAAEGELFCLDSSTGTQLWHNKLPGLGTGLVSIATNTGSNAVNVAMESHRQAAQTAAMIAASS